METHRLRVETQPYGIRKLDAGPEVISIQFVPDPPIDPMKLIKLIQTKREYKLAGQDRIRLEKASGTLEARLALLRGFIKEIA
jgi:transcription-repair coupling factor (superfamily II helicase)